MKLIKEKSTLVAKEPDFTFCVEELPLNLKRMLCYVKKSGDAPKKCRRDGENFSVTLNINKDGHDVELIPVCEARDGSEYLEDGISVHINYDKFGYKLKLKKANNGGNNEYEIIFDDKKIKESIPQVEWNYKRESDQCTMQNHSLDQISFKIERENVFMLLLKKDDGKDYKIFKKLRNEEIPNK